MKYGISVIILILICSSLYSLDLAKPVASFRKVDLRIHSWKPPSGLAVHIAKGKNKSIDPYYNLDINLGYIRLFTKSFIVSSSAQDVTTNSNFPFILELKLFDLISFANSGSSYSIYVEKNDWLRNLTFIVTNRNFSSTQFISSFMLWYGDFLSSILNISALAEPNTFVRGTITTTIDLLYLPTRRLGFGFSDRIHIYQSHNMALGLVLYYEMNIPKGSETVLKNYRSVLASNAAGLSYASGHAESSRLTFAALGGLYFRYKKNNMDMNANILYQRRQGNFDVWGIKLNQNSVFLKYEISFNKQFYIHSRYFLIHTDNGFLNETFYSNILNFGLEIKGLDKDNWMWLGIGFDIFGFYFIQKRNISSRFNAEVRGIHIFPSINVYPLSFHTKNHSLKMSFLFGVIFADQQSSGSPFPSQTQNVDQEDIGIFGFMFRISYDLSF